MLIRWFYKNINVVTFIIDNLIIFKKNGKFDNDITPAIDCLSSIDINEYKEYLYESNPFLSTSSLCKLDLNKEKIIKHVDFYIDKFQECMKLASAYEENYRNQWNPKLVHICMVQNMQLKERFMKNIGQIKNRP